MSDAARAARLLERRLGPGTFRVEGDHHIRVTDPESPREVLARTLLEGGVELYDLHLCEDTLEDYFKRVTGGEGIA